MKLFSAPYKKTAGVRKVPRRLAIFAVKLLSLFRSSAQCDVEGDESTGTVV